VRPELPLLRVAPAGHKQTVASVCFRVAGRNVHRLWRAGKSKGLFTFSPTRRELLGLHAVRLLIAPAKLVDQQVSRCLTSQVGCSSHPYLRRRVIFCPKEEMVLQAFGSGYVAMARGSDHQGHVASRNLVQLVRSALSKHAPSKNNQHRQGQNCKRAHHCAPFPKSEPHDHLSLPKRYCSRDSATGRSRPSADGRESPVSGRLVDMKIGSLEIDSSGALFVQPETDESYEYIYREGNGLRWDRRRRGLHAYEPARWGYAELLRHIAITLRDSYDEDLVFTDSTSWNGVPEDLQRDLRRVLAEK